MIVADENLHGALVQALIEHGYEVKQVTEINQGAADEEVIAMAFDEAATLITEDKDFGELVFAY